MVNTRDFSCPKGGRFYICAGNATEFLGCCTSDPCANGSGDCPASNRRVSSFSLDVYPNIQAQSCDDPRPSKEIFWTCKNEGLTPASVPFIGCCATNPCTEKDGMCPTDNLISTTLSKNASARAFFVGDESSSATPSPSASSTPESGSGGGLATGAIVGIAIGAAVAIGVIIAIIWRCGWHSRKRNERLQSKWEASPPAGHPEMGFVSSPHSPSPYEPSRSPIPYDPARTSYVKTAVPSSYASSPPRSPYYPIKHSPSPVINDRHMSTYTDSNVSSLSGHGHSTGHPAYSGPPPDLHPVSELDGIEHHPPVEQNQPTAPLAELGDGMPASQK